jgi:hypothetical protein
MNLFLDDIRSPNNVSRAYHGFTGKWEEFPFHYSWDIVRSYKEFIEYILQKGLPERISYDHDLSLEHYPLTNDDVEKPIEYSTHKEKTGLHCAIFVTEYCLVNNLELPDWYVHSFNPVGRQNIINELSGFERMRDVYLKTVMPKISI